MFYLFSNNILVNFDEVVAVKKTQNRLIINMSYSITKNDEEYVEYIYVDDFTEGDLEFISSSSFQKNFIKVANVYINKKKISNVKYSNGKIIFNLAVTKTHFFKKNGKNEKVTSSVFYYEYADQERFNTVIGILRGE